MGMFSPDEPRQQQDGSNKALGMWLLRLGSAMPDILQAFGHFRTVYDARRIFSDSSAPDRGRVLMTAKVDLDSGTKYLVRALTTILNLNVPPD